MKFVKILKLGSAQRNLELINARFLINMNRSSRNSISRFKKLITLRNETREEDAEGGRDGSRVHPADGGLNHAGFTQSISLDEFNQDNC